MVSAALTLQPTLRERLARVAEALAVATAISLPWSTSATGILIVLWAVTAVPTLDWRRVRQELLTPAGGLPVLLWSLGAVGMLWADVDWSTRLHGLSGAHKLLLIPLLIAQFRTSGNGLQVAAAFLLSATALLLMSWAGALSPQLVWLRPEIPGIPVKDYIAQSGEFVLCAVALLHLSITAFRGNRKLLALGFASLSALFLANIVYVATGRTALVVLPFLILIVGLQRFAWKGVVLIAILAGLVASAAWFSSPYLQIRVKGAFAEVRDYQTMHAMTSSGQRLAYWKSSLQFIAAAPLLGHGTGSIQKLYTEAATRDRDQILYAVNNPHNQILAVAIPLGLVGTAVLLAMWASHLLLFRGHGIVPWLGTILVLQNMLSSLFNSHLFDFTQGWIYVFGVGVLGGLMRRSALGQDRITTPPQRST